MILEQHRHWMFTLDPIHVGSGREQLTSIALPHVREKGTGLPVVPGSSLSGSCRAYAALHKGGSSCAGKGGDDGMGHCGNCHICYAFGYSRGKEQDKAQASRQGLIQISTAHILFFPIASALGPVWITCRQQLDAAGLPADQEPATAKYRAAWGVNSAGPALDLSWNRLMHDPGAAGVSEGSQFLKSFALNGADPVRTTGTVPCVDRITRAIVVNDGDFHGLIEANMEVRTLVSIKPETGAADPGMLFTYEAIPRAALLWFDVVYSNPEHYGVPAASVRVEDLKATTRQGFDLMKFLGLGGMNTRGLGRVEIAVG